MARKGVTAGVTPPEDEIDKLVAQICGGSSREVTPSQLKRLLASAMDSDRPMMIWGSPGIGKSDIIWQIGQEQKRPVIDIRLLLCDPTDLKGIPFYNPSTGRMEWSRPSDLPMGEDDNSILFFDELLSADRTTQGAAYQIFLDKRIGPHIIPQRCSLVAASNRMGDRGVVNDMPTPLRNRFNHQYLKATVADFSAWAIRKKLSAIIISFLERFPEELNRFDPKSPNMAFQTPRTWAFADRHLKKADLPEGHPQRLSEADLIHLVAGEIGEAATTLLMKYRRIHTKLPSIIGILTGRIKTLGTLDEDIRTDRSVRYSLALTLGYKLREIQDKEIEQDGEIGEGYFTASNNFFQFILDNFEAELAVMAATRCLNGLDLFFEPDRIPAFGKFEARYGSTIRFGAKQA